jgi:hypothetical protein
MSSKQTRPLSENGGAGSSRRLQTSRQLAPHPHCGGVVEIATLVRMSSLRIGFGQGAIAALFTASLLLGNACTGDGGEVDFDPIGGSAGSGATSTTGGGKQGQAGSSKGGMMTAGGGASSQAGATSNGGASAGTAAGGSNSAGTDAGGTDAGGTDTGGMAGNAAAGMGGAGTSGVGGGGMAGAGGAPACTPAIEVCDGLDNDCDKVVDQGITCAAGCTGATYGGHSYAFCGAVDSAPAALTRCQSMSLGMVMIQSQAENAFVTSKINGSSWLGATDQGQEGRWVWYASGEVFWNDGPVDGKYQNWLKGQPNNGPKGAEENCLVIQGGGANQGEWNDFGCAVAGYRAACESTAPIP